jgi:hypothetical protein
LTYFPSDTSFFVTDGVTVKDISKNRVSDFFAGALATSNAITGALDERRSLIYWSFRSGGSFGDPDTNILVYNYAEDRWGYATQANRRIFTGQRFPSGVGVSEPYRPFGFASSRTLCAFTGTAGTATLVSGEFEPSRGGYSRVQGIKPLVDQTAVTVAVGTRNDQATTPAFTSEVTANARSGFADFRSEGRYHRARLTITGTYNSAQGMEPQVEPSGPV